MKKIFTLIAVALMAVTVNAQVVFCDPAGKEYADGETMTIVAEENQWKDMVCLAPELKNLGSSRVTVSVNVDIKSLPEGTFFADCFSGACKNYKEVGSHMTGEKAIEANSTLDTMMEWNLWSSKAKDYVKGTCEVELTLYVNGTKGQTVTVRYVNGDVTAISSVKTNGQVKEAYTLDGRIARQAKGVTLQRQADGKVRKVFVK